MFCLFLSLNRSQSQWKHPTILRRSQRGAGSRRVCRQIRYVCCVHCIMQMRTRNVGNHFVQTPKQKRVVVPTWELAAALAMEWDSQVDRIRPTSMPLVCTLLSALEISCPSHIRGHTRTQMKLVMTVLDHVSENRRDLLDSFMRTLRNDAIWCVIFFCVFHLCVCVFFLMFLCCFCCV